MGFLDGLGRMISGKPVFEEDTGKPAEQPSAAGQPIKPGLRDENGNKIIPDIDVRNLKSRRNGNDMTVTGWITNDSDHRIRIDSVRLLNQKHQINQELSPQQAREVTLYQGPVAHSEHEHEAQIIYRIQENGDLFQNDYFVEYNRESDGMYTVEELHEEGEVRDI